MISFNINIDIEILSKLDEESLFNIFLTNKYINNLSKNDELWILRINKYFPGAYLLRTEDKSCLIDPFELLEVDKKKLINLWIRGNQTKNIEHVYQNTQTSSLREYLQDIRVLPTFSSET